MSRLELILIAITILSLSANIFFFIFTRTILARLLFISEELGDFQDMVDNFAKHTKSVYEMDSFYGDETLQHLLDHTGELTTFLVECENAYALTEGEFEQYVEDNEKEDGAPADESGWR